MEQKIKNQENRRRILCYGDSNTWGYTAGTGERLSEHVRWTGVCRDLLGEDYEILEDGLNGRTTVYDTGRNPYQNGRTGLGYALLSQKPLDLVILFLGTNDLEFVPAASIAVGMDELLRLTMNASAVYRTDHPIFRGRPRALVVAPPLIDERIDGWFPGNTVYGKAAEMKKLAGLYHATAEKRGALFLDAAKYAQASPKDCVHMDPESHRRLGEAIAELIRGIDWDGQA